MSRAGWALLCVAAAAGLGGASSPDRRAEIAALQRRAAETAPGTPAARTLAAELGALGGELLADGELGPAIEILGEAHGLDEDNGLVLARLTLAYLGAEDLETARFYLGRAERHAAGAPPEIYRVLGDAYQGLHRLDDAVTAWSEAVRLGGQDPGMLASLARVRDELALSRGQRTFASQNFVLFGDPALSEATLRDAAASLEAAYVEISGVLGVRLERPQVVVLYSGRDYFSLVSVPAWAAGLFDGKLRVSFESDGSEPWAVSRVLTHELAHALLRQASRDRAPCWLHEGFAQWSEGRRIPRRELAAALGGGPAESLGALDARLRGSLDRPGARASYAQSLSLVEYLVAARGPGSVACIGSALAAGASFADALRAETGWSTEDLFAGWKRWAGV